jgi:RHS repeat-associated protein
MKATKYLLAVLLLWALSGVKSQAQNDPSSDASRIGNAMRQIQARVRVLNKNNPAGDIQWPACINGQKAPSFPADNFYAGEVDDPDRAIVLVQAIKSAFNSIYPSFVNTSVPVVGQTAVTYLASTDFPFSGTGLNKTNYEIVLGEFSTAIGKLETLASVSTKITNVEWTYVQGIGAQNGQKQSTDFIGGAQGAAYAAWNNTPWVSLPSSISQLYAQGYLYEYTVTNSDPLNYYAVIGYYLENVSGAYAFDFSAYSEVSPQETIYLQIAPESNPPTVPTPVAIDNKYHVWQLAQDTTPSWVTPTLCADMQNLAVLPAIPGTQASIGWSVTSVLALIKCTFDPKPDEGITCCGDCSRDAAGNCLPGSTQPSLGSVHLVVSGGSGGKDNGAAYFVLSSEVATPGLSSPAALSVTAPPTVTLIRLPSGTIRQLVSLDSFVDLYPISTGYEIRYFPLSAKGSFNTSTMLYPDPDPSAAYKIVRVENPDTTGATYNQLRVTEIPQPGVSTVSLYTFTQSSGVSGWSLSTGNGAATETLTQSWNSDQSVRTDTRILTQASGTPAVLSKTISAYTRFPWGLEKTQEVKDPDGTPLTSTWTYDTNASDSGYGRVTQWVDGTGYWEQYSYDANGMLAKTVKQYLGSGVGATDAQSEVETIQHTASAAGVNPVVNTITTIHTVTGFEVGRSYTIYTGDTNRRDEVCTVPGAAAGASTSLVTITTYTDATHAKIASVQRPDGTGSVYSETANTDTVSEGAFNGTSITDGTQTVTTYNDQHRVVSTVTTSIGGTANGIRIASESGTNFDAFGRAQTWIYLDGTTRQVQYGCCGIETEIDRDGIETDYTYDAYKNPSLETRAGITTQYVYDPLGRLVSTTRIGNSALGPNPISVVTQAATYDPAGRQKSSADLLGTTTISEVYASGIKTRTETVPGGATLVEVTSTDGRLLSTGGTGQHGVTHQYSTSLNGFQYDIETQASGPRITRATDIAGRQTSVTYADGSFEQMAYYANGQIASQTDADGITTFYGYNDKGEQITQTVADRTTTTVQDVTTEGADTVQRTTVSEAGVVVSVDEQAVTNRKRWHKAYGLVTSTVITGTGASLLTTTTAPDGSITAETSSNGRLVARTAPSATTAFAYDGNGRLLTETDVRPPNTIIRVTTNSYNPLDQLTGKSVNGGSSGTLTTTYTYLPHGEMGTATLPGGGTSVHTYCLTGELQTVGGTAEYPVTYAYDAQGRMTSMATATGTTTWTYDASRGWLSSKSDGVNPAVTYTYQHSGRLATRRWSRGITTSYQYGAAGDIAGVSYSDGTPSTAITYDNRGRQATLTDAAGTHTFGYWMASGVSTHLPASEAITGGVLNGVNISNFYDTLLRRSAFSANLNSATVAGYTDAYDSASRLASVTDNMNWGLSAAYTYVPSSSLISTVALSQGGATRVTLNKTFDNHDRQLLSSAVPASGPPVSYTYTYDASGRRSQATLADSSSWQYGYDSRGEVTSGVKQWGDGTSVFGAQFGYGFDAIGNRLSTTINGRGATYTPNTLNQYTSRSVPGYVDVTGEINAAVTALTVNTLTPTRQNSGAYYGQELSVNNASSPVYLTTTVSATSGTNTSTVTGHEYVPKTPENYTYDADGNLTTDGRWQYTWDGENRPITVETNAAAVTAGVPKQRLTFAYDSQDRRISKKLENWNGTAYIEHHTYLFVYDGWNLAAEIFKPTGMAVRSYVWGADLSGGTAAGGVGGLLFVHQSPENKSYSYGYDGNGNVTSLHDTGDGSLAARYEYGPFSEVIRATGSMARINPFRFSTKYRDDEADLLYYGYRYSNPFTGRWLSRDPIQEHGGFNLYAFSMNSPLNILDILGLGNYKLGGPTEPPMSFDEDFGFDPHATATRADYWSWVKWGAMLEGSEWIRDDLVDANEAYAHYRDGTGTDLGIDYEKAYRDDSAIHGSLNNEIFSAETEAERLAPSVEAHFTMTGNAVRINGATTEDWQKTIGAHWLWGAATVKNCGNKFTMTIALHEKDRYNFNHDAKDIATDLPDNANGRFAVLGWAKSFFTNGEVVKKVTWEKGKEALTTTIQDPPSR